MSTLYQTYLKQLDKIEYKFDQHQRDNIEQTWLAGFAKYSAKIQCQIDDGHQWLMRSLMQAMDPDRLRIFLAMNTLQVIPTKELNEKEVLARNTVVVSNQPGLEYQTIFPITVAPIELSEFEYQKNNGVMTFVFRPINNSNVNWSEMGDALRLYWQVPSIYAERLYQLFYHECQKIEVNGCEVYEKLTPCVYQNNNLIKLDVLPVNISREVLMEYRQFPQKFYYLSLDKIMEKISNIKGDSLCCRFYFKKNNLNLASFLERRHFKLFCSPIKRGSHCPSKILTVNEENVLYPLVPDSGKKLNTLEVESIEAWLTSGDALKAFPIHQAHFSKEQDLLWEYCRQEQGLRFISIHERYKNQSILVLANLLCDVDPDQNTDLMLSRHNTHLFNLKRLSNDTSIVDPESYEALSLNKIIKPHLISLYSSQASKFDLIDILALGESSYCDELNRIIIEFRCEDHVFKIETHQLTRAVMGKKCILVVKQESDRHYPLLMSDLLYFHLKSSAELNCPVMMELQNSRGEVIKSWLPN